MEEGLKNQEMTCLQETNRDVRQWNRVVLYSLVTLLLVGVSVDFSLFQRAPTSRSSSLLEKSIKVDSNSRLDNHNMNAMFRDPRFPRFKEGS